MLKSVHITIFITIKFNTNFFITYYVVSVRSNENCAIIPPGQALYSWCEWKCYQEVTSSTTLSHRHLHQTKISRIRHVSLTNIFDIIISLPFICSCIKTFALYLIGRWIREWQRTRRRKHTNALWRWSKNLVNTLLVSQQCISITQDGGDEEIRTKKNDTFHLIITILTITWSNDPLCFVPSRRPRWHPWGDLRQSEGGHLRTIRTEHLGTLQGPATVTSCPPRSARAQRLDPTAEASSLITHYKYN